MKGASEVLCSRTGGLAHGLAGVRDQPRRSADPLHDRVARVDAEAAANALQLQPIADIDPGRAHMDAGSAIDAIAAPGPGPKLALFQLAARLAPPFAVHHRQR